MTLADPRLLPAEDEHDTVVQFRSHPPHQHQEPHLIYLISGGIGAARRRGRAGDRAHCGAE